MLNNKIAKNASWIIACKIIQALLSFVLLMLSARYLGPSGYGKLNYAASVVSFISPVALLGFNSTLVQALVKNPEKEGETLGSAIAASFVASAFSVCGVMGFAAVANPGERDTFWVCTLYSLLLLFQSLELTQYWFQTKLLSKYTSVLGICSYIAVSAFKLFLLATEKSIYWFAVSFVSDYFIISQGLLLIYRKKGGQRLSFSLRKVRELLKPSRYYILSNLMIVIFTQTDKIMVKMMMGDEATGFYAAAVTTATVSSFLFTAVIDSFRPVILEKKQTDAAAYRRHLTQLFSIVLFLSLAQGVLLSGFSEPFIRVIYGKDYAPAAGLLRIIVWFQVFAYAGSVRDVWILAEEKQKYLGIINIAGALLNVGLNYVLISRMGEMGAAWATLVSHFVTNVLAGFLIPALREGNMLMIKGLNPKSLGLSSLMKKP
ncbi:MAG: flippase [Clostridia bacterium]|nr:flippase [Clostridia bacterium]